MRPSAPRPSGHRGPESRPPLLALGRHVAYLLVRRAQDLGAIRTAKDQRRILDVRVGARVPSAVDREYPRAASAVAPIRAKWTFAHVKWSVIRRSADRLIGRPTWRSPRVSAGDAAPGAALARRPPVKRRAATCRPQRRVAKAPAPPPPATTGCSPGPGGWRRRRRQTLFACGECSVTAGVSPSSAWPF